MRVGTLKLITFARNASLAVLLSSSSNLTASTDIGSLENISKELVEIRQAITSLHDEINYKKDSFNDQLRSYSNQKADLNVKISRSDLNIKDLQRELEKLQAENKEKFAEFDQVSPVLKDSIATLRASIENSIPFKRKERLQALADIELRLTTNTISPNKAANQLWAFVEDELVLGRSSGIYSETVEMGGEEKLVKVLRLGKVAMFYKTPQEEFGVVKRERGQWETSVVSDEASRIQLSALFDSFAKNIRNGLFEVPNFLPAQLSQVQ